MSVMWRRKEETRNTAFEANEHRGNIPVAETRTALSNIHNPMWNDRDAYRTLAWGGKMERDTGIGRERNKMLRRPELGMKTGR